MELNEWEIYLLRLLNNSLEFCLSVGLQTQYFIFSLRNRTDHYFKVKHITLMSSARWALAALCCLDPSMTELFTVFKSKQLMKEEGVS